jgi:MYXO-CTERM domain-containing protein
MFLTRIAPLLAFVLPSPALAQTTYVDASGPHTVTRLGIDPAGLVPVRVTGDRGGSFSARVDEHAIVELPDHIAAPRAHLERLGLTVVRTLFAEAGLYLVRGAPGEDGAAVAARLAPSVRGGLLLQATPDLHLARRRNQIAIPPDDPRYGGQWFYERIELERAWALTTGDPSVVIGVVDDGCDLAHPDLAAKLEPGRDFIDMDDDPTFAPGSGNEHGTACAGLVAAITDNGVGVAGTCPDCRTRCLRLIPNDMEMVPISADVMAFAFMYQRGDAVASNSWGFREAVAVPGTLAEAIRVLATEGRGGLGAVVVFAAGNDSSEIGPDELQAVEGVLTVGATTNFDEAAPFSNYGESVAITAPTGTLTLDISGPGGADPGDETSLFGGTSSSCPIVAGVAGLLVSVKPDATSAEIRTALIESARPAPFATPDARGHDPLFGYGIVDPLAALLRLRPDLATSPDAGVDGGNLPDAGVVPPPADEGCGCSASSDPPFFLAVLVLLLTRRRRGGA